VTTAEEPPTPVAYWVQGASQEQRDAHYLASRWAHVLPWAIDRLYESRRVALESHLAVQERAFFGEEDSWPFFRMDAEAHFCLVAARQLIRALRAFDSNDRLPTGLSNAKVRDLRDAPEHWDAPGGSDAAKRLQQQGAEPFSHKWSERGPGLLGDVVPDAVLREWAASVYAELLRWDPYDRWTEARP
jgi:hypothetical protein